MKKILMLMVLAVSMPSLSFADKNEDFLEDFSTFVNEVVRANNDTLTAVTIAKYEARYKELNNKYKDYFCDEMNDSQLKQYAQLRASYQKKVITFKAKRKATKVSGWVKGVVGSDSSSGKAEKE